MQLKRVPLLVTIISFIILLFLGFWQISRLNEKNLFISQITEQLNKPAPLIPDNFDDIKSSSYNKYKLTGKFIPGKDILLYSSNPHLSERHGYFIITPFALESGKVILINRGWAPQSQARNSVGTFGELTSIEAMVMLPKTPSLFVPSNDVGRNVWLYVDLKQMQDFVDMPIEQDFYMILIKGDDLPTELIIRKAEDFLQIRNDHMWYAITWFSLAIIVVIIYYLKVKQHKFQLSK